MKNLTKIAILVSALPSLASAAYDAEDVFKAYAQLGYRYDNNVFRLSDLASNSLTREHDQRGDARLQTDIGLQLDQTISRQKLYANVDLSQQNYLNFDELDHLAWQGELGWQWQFGNDFFGVLSANSGRSMSSFDDVRNGVMDIMRQDAVDWRGNWRLHSEWLLLANANYADQKHDEREYENARNTAYGFGVRYLTGKGSSVSLQHQWSEYDYQNDLGLIPADLRGYQEQVTNLSLLWAASEKLELSLSGGISRWYSKSNQTNSNSTPQADFSVKWQASEKAKFRAGYGQNFNQFSGGLGRDLERKFFLGMAWDMTEKVDWDLEYTQRRKTTEGNNTISLRDELYQTAQLSLNYAPLRSVKIKSFVRLEEREDQRGSADYTDRQFGVTARYDY